jgi:Tfp pilus assembly protein PilN
MIPKLDLLPSWVSEGKRVRNTWIAVAVVWALVLAAGLGFASQKKAQQAALQSEVEELAHFSSDLQKVKSDTTNVTTQITPVSQRTKYITDILTYDRKFPDVFEQTNKYTYYRVGFRSLQPQGTVLNIAAYCRNVSDIGRFLLNVQRAKALFTAVSITGGIPGGAAGGAASPDMTGGGFNPYASTYGASPSGYSPGGSPYAPPPSMMASANPEGGTITPGMLEFQAVAQLSQKFALTPPASPFMAATDTSGTGTGGYPAPGGGYPAPGAPPGTGAYDRQGYVPGGAPANAGGGGNAAAGGDTGEETGTTGGLRARKGLGAGE